MWPAGWILYAAQEIFVSLGEDPRGARREMQKIWKIIVDKGRAAEYNLIGKTKKNGGIRSHLQRTAKRSTVVFRPAG